LVVSGSGGEFQLNETASLNSSDGGISITADSMDIGGTVTAIGQTVHLATASADRPIALGSETNDPRSLVWSLAELPVSSADALSIGSAASGDISITDAIQFTSPINLTLTTGDHAISFDGGSLDAAGGNVYLVTGPLGHIAANVSDTDVTAYLLS